MLKARKRNRVVRIPDEKRREYQTLGYTILDETGKILYQPEDKDATIAALHRENQQLRQRLSETELLLKQTREAQKPKADDGRAAAKTGGRKTAGKDG